MILKISAKKNLKDKFKFTKNKKPKTLEKTQIIAVLTGRVPHFCEHRMVNSLPARESFLFFKNSKGSLWEQNSWFNSELAYSKEKPGFVTLCSSQ